MSIIYFATKLSQEPTGRSHNVYASHLCFKRIYLHKCKPIYWTTRLQPIILILSVLSTNVCCKRCSNKHVYCNKWQGKRIYTCLFFHHFFFSVCINRF